MLVGAKSRSERLENDRQALLPASLPLKPVFCRDALLNAGKPFLDFLLSQDLGPLWYRTLQTAGLLETLPAEFADVLHETRMRAAAGYLAQKAALGQVDALFAAEEIAYVVIKGAHVRECVYEDASLRPSSDIDILVSKADRQRAARLLLREGYQAHIELATISHEATFSKSPVHLDLHWDILRPGRMRTDMAEGFVERRQRAGGLWVLSDSDAFFLMLTHPAFTKYVCSPNMGLARVIDFLFWIQRKTVDWPEVLRMLEKTGLKTAAWTMLSWFGMLAPLSLTETLDRWRVDVRPGRLRAAYLKYWIGQDLPSRWLHRPPYIQFGFTLFMHDRASDALRAIRSWKRARRDTLEDARLLMGEAYAPSWR